MIGHNITTVWWLYCRIGLYLTGLHLHSLAVCSETHRSWSAFSSSHADSQQVVLRLQLNTALFVFWVQLFNELFEQSSSKLHVWLVILWMRGSKQDRYYELIQCRLELAQVGLEQAVYFSIFCIFLCVIISCKILNLTL